MILITFLESVFGICKRDFLFSLFLTDFYGIIF